MQLFKRIALNLMFQAYQIFKLDLLKTIKMLRHFGSYGTVSGGKLLATLRSILPVQNLNLRPLAPKMRYCWTNWPAYKN